MKNNYTQFIIYEQNFGSKVHVDFRRICDERDEIYRTSDTKVSAAETTLHLDVGY